MHSRDTGPALCNAPTPPKGPQLLLPNSVSSSPWPETPLWLSLGLRPTSGLKAMGRCRRPLFLSSGGPRDWMGCHPPPRVVWVHGKTGETGAEVAGLAEADRAWGQWALQGVGLTSLGSCVQKVELLPKVREDSVHTNLATGFHDSSIFGRHRPRQFITQTQNEQPSPGNCPAKLAVECGWPSRRTGNALSDGIALTESAGHPAPTEAE